MHMKWIYDNLNWSVSEHIKNQDSQEESRADFRCAPKQWETVFLCNNISHWLGADLESSLKKATLTLQPHIEICIQGSNPQ